MTKTIRDPHAPNWSSASDLEDRSRATSSDISPDNWFVAARTDQLTTAPLARTVLGRDVVLYRTEDGRAVAMEDRCPHKNAALSLGAVRGDTIECRYHGWRFDPSGACVDLPCCSPDEKLPACAIPTFPAEERDGWIWILPGDPARSPDAPPTYPRTEGYRWFELHNVFEAPVDLVLENGFDCSHTGFAHKGWFRSEPEDFITARVEETPTGVRVENLGEAGADRKDVRSLLGGGAEIRHVDQLILPHTLRIDYWLGERAHFVTLLVATPEGPGRTRVYTRMGIRFRAFTWLVAPLLWFVSRKVVAQDRQVLESQAERILAFGGRSFRASVADVPATWLQRTLQANNRGEYPPERLRTRDVTYRL